MALQLFANLPLKVTSLLVAAVLWLAVSGQSTVERNIRVPLEFENVPSGMEIVGDTPGSVDVDRFCCRFAQRLETSHRPQHLDCRGRRGDAPHHETRRGIALDDR